jgi:hypothetical protein
MKNGRRVKPRNAAAKPPQSHLIARGLRPHSQPQATFMRPQSHPKAIPKPGKRQGFCAAKTGSKPGAGQPPEAGWQRKRADLVVLKCLQSGATRSGVDSPFKPAIIGAMTGPDDDKYLLANHEAARL